MSTSSASPKKQSQSIDMAVFWQRYARDWSYFMRQFDKLENMIQVLERLLESQSDRVKEAYSVAIEAKRAISAITRPQQPRAKQNPVAVGNCRVINFRSACNK